MLAHAVAIRAVAALPALPLGKGAVILILGGLVALVLSLAWSLLSPRAAAAPHVARAFSGHAAALAANGSMAAAHIVRVGAPAVELPTWLERVSDATLHMGFGNLRIVGADGASFLVTLTACRSCHRQGNGSAGCALEARSLERAVRVFAPHAVASEVRCHDRGQGLCVFELRPEGPS